MWDRWKVRLCLVAAVVTLASACTDSGSDVESTPAAQQLMAGALGTQAVQDFVIHLDLAAETEDGPLSIYEAVIEQARSGAAEPVTLEGGIQLSPVDSLDAVAVDAAGDLLSSVSVDFALLEFDSYQRAEILQTVAGTLATDGSIPDGLFAEEDAGSLVVHMITASYVDGWAHVGGDDGVVFDFSFLPEAADGLVSVHLFGQTLPGDPAAEAGLTPQELFAHRWNTGRVRLVGDGDGPRFVLAEFDATDAPSSRFPSRLVAAGFPGLPEAMSLAQEQELPGPDRPAEAEEEDGPLGPDDLKLAAKTFERTVAISAAFHAGEDLARRILAEATGKPPAESAVFVEEPLHCVVVTPAPGLPGRYRVDVGVPTGENFSGGCYPLLRMTPEAYALLWATKMEQRACRWYTAHARLGNNPASGQAGGSQAPSGSTTTVDPLFSTTTFPELPPCNAPRPTTAGGGTVGDVHMITFDGLMFDNQAAGEFLLYDDGSVEVQMRTEPWPLSDVASVVTAAAVGVGDARVSMHEGGATFVDGAPVTLERGTAVELGAGSLLWTGMGWVVVGPDGTEVHVVDNLDVNGTVHIIVHPKGDEPTGMLGTVNGDQSDDLVTRSGEVYPILETGDTERFYSTFIDSWRITEDESLFHYGDGESTAGFQREDFPVRWLDFGDLDQVAKGDAETVCRDSGVTRPDLLAACIYDVVVTGDPGFAYDAFVFQETLPAPKDRPAPTSPSTSTPPPSGGNFLTIGGQTYAFEGFAAPGACSISEDSPGVSLPGFLGEATTVDAAGREVAIRVEFYALDDPFLILTVLRDGRPYAWMWEGRPESGSVEESSMAGNSLTVTGTAFLNEPENPELQPMIPLPAGTPTVPFHLQATCDR